MAEHQLPIAVQGELITSIMPSSIKPLLGGSDYREGPCDGSSMEDAGLGSTYRELDALCLASGSCLCGDYLLAT
jgi:hypothetical protein